MAVKMAGVPVRCETSPVNSPGPWMAIVVGSSPDWSRISISPVRMTKKRKLRSPTWTRTSPAGCFEIVTPGAAAELLDLLIGQGWKGNFVEIELSHGPWYTLTQNRT